MLDPVTLFEFESHIDRRTVHARTLVVTLGSRDPGHAQHIVERHVLDTLPNHLLGRVDTDQVVDYAMLRPAIRFDCDHFAAYAAPAIELHHVTDAQGTPFLLLLGPEPTLQWERLAGTVDYLIEQFGITDTVLVHGIPAPAPHTRPLHITRYAGRGGLLTPRESLPMTFELEASFGTFLALRLGERGRGVTGLVAHVPYYLAAGDVPDAAIALLDRLRRHTTLDVPAGGLARAAALMREQVDGEVRGSVETQEMITGLERHFDEVMRDRSLAAAEDVPSAEEIGAEIESFLRGLEGNDGAGPKER